MQALYRRLRVTCNSLIIIRLGDARRRTAKTIRRLWAYFLNRLIGINPLHDWVLQEMLGCNRTLSCKLPHKAASAGLLECELASGIGARREDCVQYLTEIIYPPSPRLCKEAACFQCETESA